MKARGSVRRAAAGTAAVVFGLAVYVYLTLPDVRSLRESNPATTAFIELRVREARESGRAPRRMQYWVPYDRISPHLKRAVVVAEDAAFWQHDGIDYRQLRESIEVNIARRAFARGASTITQQLAKNLYLSPEKNPVRKLREVLIARRLEAELTKTRLLELYLNVIEWGDGIYGVEAAARTYFGKTASALGRQEAALLAGAIASPRLFNPARPSARLRQRQQVILRRMGGAGVPDDRGRPADRPASRESAPDPSSKDQLQPLEADELRDAEGEPAVEPCAVLPCG